MPVRFFVITFLWSWIFFIPLYLISKGIIKGEVFTLPLISIAAFGPAIGALTSIRSINGKEAVKDHLRSFFSLKFGLKVWVSIFLFLGLAAFLAWIVPEFFGEKRIPIDPLNVYMFPVYIVVMTLLGGGQEEIGWRGYIQPMFEKRFGLIFGTIIFGTIWSVWHLPLWIIPETGQSEMNFVVFLIGSIAISYFYSWVVEASGKRLSGMVAHGAGNTFQSIFPLVSVTDAKQTRLWIFCIFIILLGTIAVLMRIMKNRAKRYLLR